MTAPPSKQSRTGPSPPLRKGEVYCLASFTARAEEWYTQEAGRQIGAQVLEGPSQERSSRRRQPTRAAKIKAHAAEGHYILSSDEMEQIVGDLCAERTRTPTPPTDSDDLGRLEVERNLTSLQECPGAGITGWNAHILSFRIRLNQAVHAKTQEIKTHHEPQGIQHICTVAGSAWDCLDEEYCGHGLIERCIRWVPKRMGDFKPRVRAEMDAFFATRVFPLEADSDRFDSLQELKRSRYSKLKAVTLGKVRSIEEEWKESPKAMVDAVMLETPTLGRWPARGFVREEVDVQTVKFAGLVFAVDICQGELRVMML